MNNPQLISRTNLVAIVSIVVILFTSQPALANGIFNPFSHAIENNDYPAFLDLYQTYAGKNEFLQMALYEAVQRNRPNMVQYLHERGMAITPRVVTAITPNDESVELLGYLLANCDSGIAQRDGQMLLGRAAYEQSSTALQLLVDYGIAIDAVKRPLQQSLQPLLSLAMGQRSRFEDTTLTTVTWLVENGAPINEKDDLGRTPLMNAVSQGYPMVSYLLRYGADPDAHLYWNPSLTALAIARELGKYDCVALLDGTIKYDTAVIVARSSRSPRVVTNVMTNGWSSRSFPVLDLTVVMSAAFAWWFGRRFRRVRVMAILALVILAMVRLVTLTVPAGTVMESKLDSRADVRLVTPSVSGSVNRVNLNAREQRFGKTELFIAAERGDLSRVQELSAQGADLEIPNYDRVTPLVIAAYRGHNEVVRYLIDKGADAGLVLIWCLEAGGSEPNGTPYSVHERAAIIDCLCRNGADVNARVVIPGNSVTPIVIAAWRGSSEMVAILLRHGAKLTPYQVNGGPSIRGEALGRAVLNPDPKVLSVLIKAAGPVEFEEVHQVCDSLCYADFRRLMVICTTLRCPALSRDQLWGFAITYGLADAGAARLREFDKQYPGVVTPAVATFALRATINGPVIGAYERGVEYKQWLLRKGADLNARDWDGKRIRDVFREYCGDNWEAALRD